MKIRFGFVSNSSSTSFVIGAKKKPTKKQLMELFAVSKNSIIFDFVESMADFILRRIKERKWEELERDYSEVPEEYCRIKEKGFKIFEGYAETESDDPAEMALLYMTIDYEADDFIIYKGDEGF